MRVLVTGATGFIGRALCAELASAGHTVAGLSRDPEAARRRVPSLSAAFAWRPVTGPPPEESFQGVDAVVHLAGASLLGRWTVRKKRDIWDSRVPGTRHLVDAIARLDERPRTLLSASAFGYYGDRGDAELTEADAPGDDFLGGVCRAWEEAALGAEALGVRVTRLRTGLVLGRGGGMLGPMVPLFRLGLGGRLGPGSQWWPWIHMADVTGLLRSAVEGMLSGAINATAPASIRQLEFAQTLARVLRRPALLRVPTVVLKLVLGEGSDGVLSSARVLPNAALAAGYRFRFEALEPALRDVLGRAG